MIWRRFNIISINPKPTSQEIGQIVSAAWDGDNAFIETALEKQGPAIIDARNTQGLTALGMAASHGKIETMALLLDKGANTLEAKNKTGQTALALAAMYGQAEAVTFLLGRGAAIDAADDEGCTGLMLAVREAKQEIRREGRVEVIQLLLSRGADLDVCHKETGQTAEKYAQALGVPEITRLLRQAREDRARDEAEKKAEEMQSALGRITGGLAENIQPLRRIRLKGAEAGA